MSDKHITLDRQPAVAGQFYPSDEESLQVELKKLFSAGTPAKHKNVRAIISPHAGYIFSGKTAASAFKQIDGRKQYEHVFILASSHQYGFKGASVYCGGDFLMPFGKVAVDTELGKTFVENYPELFTDDYSPHTNEHGIEVQLPFLDYVMKKEYKIVPIILGTNQPQVCSEIAAVLKPYLNEKNLFIISSDFSHYPDYENAKSVDATTALAICSNQPDQLLKTLKDNAQKRIPNLATSLCGWTSVLTLLDMTENDEFFSYKGVNYTNSGDAHIYGDQNKVVGYWGIVLTEKENKNCEMNIEEEKQLLKIARHRIEGIFKHDSFEKIDISELPEALKLHCGAFVTIHNGEKLRGCYGRMIGDKPLFEVVEEMAVWAAERDYRFEPVFREELDDIDIEISVLSPMKKIKNISEIELGVHGIYLLKDGNSGVFLPQVATETGWDLESFLGHCARDKAGIGWEGWKDAEIFIFSATIFGEKDSFPDS